MKGRHGWHWAACIAAWTLVVSCGNPPPPQGQGGQPAAGGQPAQPAGADASGAQSAAASGGEPVNTARYQAADKHFTIALPTDWQAMESYQGTAVTAFGPRPDPKAELPVLNVAVERLNEPIALADYVTKSRERLAKDITGFKELESGDASLGGQPAKWLLASYRLETREIKALVHFTVIDHEAFVITAATDPKYYDGMVDRFKELVNSFQYVPAKAAATEPAAGKEEVRSGGGAHCAPPLTTALVRLLAHQAPVRRRPRRRPP